MGVRIFLLICLLHLVQSKNLHLSCRQIRTFVDGHNSRRLSLARGRIRNQPTASNMKYMVWDNELAEKAARWSTNLEFKHNPNNTIRSRRFRTGENIYMQTSSHLNKEFDINKVLQDWFTEYKHYTYGPIKMSDFNGRRKPIGHYTQMAWADTVYVGCGVSTTMKNGMKRYFVVCNYGPAGNMLGKTPYKTGRSRGRLTCLDDCEEPYGYTC